MTKTYENITHITIALTHALSQQVTTRLQGTDNTVKQRQPRNTNNKKEPQKKHRLGMVSKLLEDLNMLNGTNLILCSDVDQDTYVKVTKTQHTREPRGQPVEMQFTSYCKT